MFGVVANKQTLYWRDSETLWRHTLAVGETAEALDDLGFVLVKEGRYDEARPLLERVFALIPEDDDALCTMGVLLWHTGHPDEAKEYFVKALSVNPQHVETLINLGSYLLERGSTMMPSPSWNGPWTASR